MVLKSIYYVIVLWAQCYLIELKKKLKRVIYISIKLKLISRFVNLQLTRVRVLTKEGGDRKLHNGYKIKWPLNRALLDVYFNDDSCVGRKRSGINDFPVRPGRPRNVGKEWRISIMETHPPRPVLNFSSDKGAFCRYQIRVTPWWRHISTYSRRCVSTYIVTMRFYRFFTLLCVAAVCLVSGH